MTSLFEFRYIALHSKFEKTSLYALRYLDQALYIMFRYYSHTLATQHKYVRLLFSPC